MTCVVGVAEAGNVLIGADSAAISGWDLIVRADKKIFRNDGFLIGFTTSFRMGQILQYSFSPPARNADIDVSRYMRTAFVDSIREALKRGGFAKKESEVESGGIFLIGYEGHLFQMDSDFQVIESIDNVLGIGCGGQIALGSMFSTVGKTPHYRIMKALEAAEHYSAGVRGPFTILRLYE